MLNLITPDWPAPKNIKAFTTTRIGGYSQAPYDSFNLAIDIGDDHPENIIRNRALLKEHLRLPGEPVWIKQIHGINVIQADSPATDFIADASFTYQPNVVCAITTADCLPLLVTDQTGSCVAAIHAGWHGLAAGVIEATLKKLDVPRNQLLIWLGPAIGPEAFEVGEEVYQQFVDHDMQAKQAFKRNSNGRWLANIYLLAKQRFLAQGVTQIFGGEFCTYTDKKHFYSYRRDQQTGRMASLIWLT